MTNIKEVRVRSSLAAGAEAHGQRPCGREEYGCSGKLKDTAACDSTATLKSLGCFYILIMLKKKTKGGHCVTGAW